MNMEKYIVNGITIKANTTKEAEEKYKKLELKVYLVFSDNSPDLDENEVSVFHKEIYYTTLESFKNEGININFKNMDNVQIPQLPIYNKQQRERTNKMLSKTKEGHNCGRRYKIYKHFLPALSEDEAKAKEKNINVSVNMVVEHISVHGLLYSGEEYIISKEDFKNENCTLTFDNDEDVGHVSGHDYWDKKERPIYDAEQKLYKYHAEKYNNLFIHFMEDREELDAFLNIMGKDNVDFIINFFEDGNGRTILSRDSNDKIYQDMKNEKKWEKLYQYWNDYLDDIWSGIIKIEHIEKKVA